MSVRPRLFSAAWATEYFEVAHLLIASVGFIALMHRAATVVIAVIQSPFPIVFNQWAMPFYFPEKREELYGYVLTAAALLAYYIAAYFLVRHRAAKRVSGLICGHKGYLAAYLVLALVINAALFYLRTSTYPLSALVGAVWVIFTAGVFVPVWLGYWCTENEDSRPVYRAAWLLVCLQFAAIFLPFLAGPTRLVNEFFDIPEQTLVAGRYVDNTAFINDHDLLGLPGDKYSIGMPQPRGPSQLEVHVPPSVELDHFIAAKNEDELTYMYDSRRQVLQFVGGSISAKDLSELRELVVEPDIKRAITEVYYSNQDRQRAFQMKTYTEEEREFIKANQLEVVRQVQSRWVLHHHNFILAPIAQLAAGRPLHEIYMQYGLLNTVGMTALLQATGGITLQNYFSAWFSFYPLYFALYVALAFFMFRRKLPYVLTATALAAAVLNLIDFQYLLLGPGLNPIRHIHDVLVLWALFLYFRRRTFAWLLLAGIATVVGVLNNPPTGLFSAAAFCVTCVAMMIADKWRNLWPRAALLAATAAGCVYAYSVSKATFDPVSKYYLAGLLGFPVDGRLALMLLGFASLGYMVLLLRRNSESGMKFIALYLLLYSQGLLVYFIWGGTLYHFLNMAVIYTLTLVTIAYVLIEDPAFSRQTANTLKCVAVALAMMFYVPTIAVYYHGKRQYDRVFDTHQVYEWRFDTVRLASTADPAYFERAVALVRKYVPESRIYIISKYDYILPFLSGKYSGLPYFDLAWFLLTKREIENSIRAIVEARPQYLFVDADIDRNLASDVISSKHPVLGSLHKESVLRVERLSKLKDVFNAVRQDYVAVDHSPLLTVYKRR